MNDGMPASEALTSFFAFRRADTPELRDQIHRLRYEVYCREFGFEREEDCPGQREVDQHDSGAEHCILIHRDSGRAAGCVRLLGPDDPMGSGENLLPLERIPGALSRSGADALYPQRLPRHSICEISRLAVLAAFRRRRGEGKTPFGDPDGLVFSVDEVRAFPLLAVGLFLAATAMVGISGRPHVFAMMEPRLARLLGRSGLHFSRVGSIVEFHGRRAPFYIDQRVAEQTMVSSLRELYGHICDSLAEAGETANRERSQQVAG